MNIKLSDSSTYKKLLYFALPYVIIIFFSSMHSVVDGSFVSNYAGAAQFAAVNFIMPFLILFGSP